MEEHRSSRIEAAGPAGITTACDRSRRHSFGSAAGGSPQAHRLGPHVSNPGGRLSNRLRDTRLAMMMASSKSFAFATEGMPTADLARGVLLRWRTERPTAPRPGSRFSTPSSCRIRRRGWRRCARVRWMCWDRAGHQLPASERHRRMSRQERNPCGGYLASPSTCSITASTWGPSARPQYLERSFILTRVFPAGSNVLKEPKVQRRRGNHQ